MGAGASTIRLWTTLLLAAAIGATAVGTASGATTFTVNSADDPGDGVCDPAHCTLREAINAANAAPGADTIVFDIAPGGVVTIKPASVLPVIADPVAIDGTTQPGYAGSPIVELDGNAAGGNGLTITAGSSTVRGLVINRFGFPNAGILLQSNGGNLIEGNFIGTDVTGTVALPNGVGLRIEGFDGPGNTIGGTTVAARNVISGNVNGLFITGAGAGRNLIQGNFIGTSAAGTGDLGNGNFGLEISNAPGNIVGGTTAGARNIISGNDGPGLRISGGSATGNLVQGNFIGTDVTGTQDLGNVFGVGIGSSGNTVGGTAEGTRNVISGNDQTGVVISSFTASGNLIQGNFIGTDVTGTADLGNFRGVEIQGPNNIVGGTTEGARNVISGNDEIGVHIVFTAATGNLVQGNFIGTDATGTRPLGNSADGVTVQLASNNAIGGTASGAANVIAHNGGVFGGGGVLVLSGTGNAILTNSIHSNANLGIDLFPRGVTPNDPFDSDTGANELQNFPVLAAAKSGGGSTSVEGTLFSTPTTTYRLEFFASSACDVPSAHGEGERFLGGKDVTTDASGSATFTATFAAGVPPGQVVTATATDPSGNTSEFSACALVVPAVAGPAVVTLDPPAAVNDVGTSHTVTATVTDVAGQPVPGVTVRFSVEGSVTASGSCTTDANGRCSFTYTGPALPGADLVTAFADTDVDGTQDAGEPEGSATKAWILPATTPGQVTGGGHILNATVTDEIAFGFNAQSTDSGVRGNCNVVDRSSETHVKCLDVTSLVQTATHATFFGNATVNGVATTYRIDVDDLAEPGAGSDTFSIQAGSGFTAGGVLIRGNIQIHRQS